MLELKDICFEKEHKKILDHINLTFDPKRFYVMTGPNGSGKSTLVKIIMGIEKPDSGQILFHGKDITHLSLDERARLGFGYAFQQPVTFKGITVFDLLKLAVNQDLDKEEAMEILMRVGITSRHYLEREVNHSLSGGELKRIEIATVLARKPLVSIFDEPEAGIDFFQQIESTSKGMTLVISHQERILNIADQIILLEDGKIKEVGNRDKMMPLILNHSKKMEVD